MAKSRLTIQRATALMLVFFLAVPMAALASDGQKHFKEGVKYEDNRQWDKAAEQFALAVSEKPSNIEFQLHLQRALIQAGLMLVERGDRLAEQKDFNAAYNAYRQGYAFDPTNELALVKMRRMLEVQGLPTDGLPRGGDPAGPSYKRTPDTNVKAAYPGARNVQTQAPTIPERKFAKVDVIYRETPLLTALEQLAQSMKLNVIFDQQVVNMMRAVKVNVELRDVTYPHALEMLLKTNNLMYAQVDARTLVIASDNPQSRQRYEPYSVRTFYIKNADLNDVRGAIQGTLLTKSITSVKQLNALIVRDTPADLELIEALINSMDKAKAEVLIDINIYEVSRNNMLQIGNQFNVPGSDGQTTAGNLGAIGGLGQSGLGGFAHNFLSNAALGFTLGLPPSLISFFQDKGKAKLLASTQVHVLDDQDQTIRIGQRVPIQTAFIPTYNNSPIVSGNNNASNNANNFAQGVNPFGTSGFPQFQYENVGLNIDMKPRVFEDEIELKMKIESSSLDRSTGNFTPSFNQRTMSTMARIKDGQPTLVAGVTQTELAKGVKGIPIIGLIPILGRFFATPSTTDRQSDVVITVTPHILRRADIREEDHYARAAGDLTNPTPQLKIAQILYIADQEDAQQAPIADAGPPPAETRPVVQPPAPQTNMVPVSASPGVVVQGVPTQPPTAKANIQRMSVERPGVSSTSSNDQKSGQVNQQTNPRNKLDDDDDDDDEDTNTPQQKPLQPLLVSVKAATPVATRGQDLFVAVILNGNNDISSAHISLSYDPNIIEAKSVRDSGLLRTGGGVPELQFTGEGGLLNIQMDKPAGSGGAPARGQLCLIVFTVKNIGVSPLTINEAQTYFRTPNAQPLPLRILSSQVEVR